MEIKIRAFDETSGEFAYSKDTENEYYFWCFDRAGDVCCYFEVEKLGNSECDPPEIVPEEVSGPYELWTTHQDKNGKDIYEGDIVRIFNALGDKFVAEVKFIDGCFDIQMPGNRDYLKCYTVNHAVEIIGNIHENPELVKE